MEDPTDLAAATRRLIRTADGLADADYGAPTECTGWTRAHVLAHLALNAEGLAGALRGIVEGRPTPMYASQERRDRASDAGTMRRSHEVHGRIISRTDYSSPSVMSSSPGSSGVGSSAAELSPPDELVPPIRLTTGVR